MNMLVRVSERPALRRETVAPEPRVHVHRGAVAWAGHRRGDRRVLARQRDRAAHAAGAGSAAALPGAIAVAGARVRRPLLGADLRALARRARPRAAPRSCSRRRASPACSCSRTATRSARAATVQLVSGEYFTALRQQAQLGRLLAPIRQPRRRGASGRRHQRQLLAAALRDRARRRRPPAGDQRHQLHGDRASPRPRFFGTTLALARARRVDPVHDAAGRPLFAEREQQQQRGSAEAVAAAARDGLAERVRPRAPRRRRHGGRR